MAPETPKGVSSRLLGMKFMQRAAASAASTPTSENDSPSAKKRKLGQDDDFSAHIDQASIQAAIEEREAKRRAAIDKQGGSDTHWVLDTNWSKKSSRPKDEPRKVLYVGYGDIDDEEADGDHEGGSRPGRTSTKDYKKAKTDIPEDSDSDSDSQGDDDDDDGSRNNTPKSGDSRRRSHSRSDPKQKAEASKAKEFRDKRKKKEVRLNKLTSISSAGASQLGSPGSQGKPMTCFTCQKQGHKASDCPSKGSKGTPKRS